MVAFLGMLGVGLDTPNSKLLQRWQLGISELLQEHP